MNKYEVIFENKTISYLNENLVKQQKVSDENLAALRLSHQLRYIIFERAKNTENSKVIKELAGIFEQLEFLQQDLWGFNRDSNYHRWFEFPKCDCPKLDNQDRIGTSYRIISEVCSVHGKN